MGATRYRDFDAAVAELEPIRFRIAGRDHTLKSEPSAKALLTIWDADDDELNVEESRRIIIEIIGQETYDQILSDGATLTQVFMLCRWLVEQSGGEMNGDEANPNPNRATRRAAAKKSPSKKSAKVGRR